MMLDEPWTLSPSVALHPEPIGALAYHFGNRKLTFLKRPELVLLRHWWPAAAAGALGSRRVRRALVSALVLDAAIATRENQRSRTPLPLSGLLAGRGLDSLAYGSGLWHGAIKARSTTSLRPRRPGTKPTIQSRFRSCLKR